MTRLPMVEDFVVDLGDSTGTTPSRRGPFPREPRPPLPDSAKVVVGIGLLAAIGLTVGGAYLGYRVLRGRFPFAGLVGGVAGFYLVPKVAGPVVGSLLKPMSDKATADMKARGLMGTGCAGCGG